MKDTLIDQFIDVVARFPQKQALLFRKDHHFESLTYEELYKYAEHLAAWLAELGVRENDRILLVSENRPEWVITDIASLLLGAVLVPVHSVLAASQVAIIADEVEPKVALVDTRENLDKVLGSEALGKIKIGYFEDSLRLSTEETEEGRILSLKEKIFDTKPQKLIEPIKHKPERVVTIIYTSGTTGRFKGAMLTNKNFMANLEGVLATVEITEADKFLSVLPLSHIFERTVGYYIPLMRGATVSYLEDPKKLAEYARAEGPTIIIGVPRLFEKVYQGVIDKACASFVKRIIFNAALATGRSMPKGSLAYKLADKVVFHKIKEAFGGNIRFFVSGAASLAREIGEFFAALDIPVLEGYGLTETSPIISSNTLTHMKYGTVGRALPGIETKLTKNGELLVRGNSVFPGYYKQPDKTKEAFTSDGWFKTGDLVEIDKAGFIKFKAREKEIIALSTGKKVSPAYVEEKLQLIPEINQAFVFGDGQKHIAALIVPEDSVLRGKTKSQKRALIESQIECSLNGHVAKYERITTFILLKQPFTVVNGLLTPTLKLRRKEIELKYVKEINSVYGA